jgi:hypothetical protein
MNFTIMIIGATVVTSLIALAFLDLGRKGE